MNGAIEGSIDNSSNKMTVKVENNEVITIEPAYTCVGDDKRETCTAKEGELIVSENGQKVQIKSQSLYDWLMVEWRKELDGPTKEELLEEALYTRYLDQLGQTYSEFLFVQKSRLNPSMVIRGDISFMVTGSVDGEKSTINHVNNRLISVYFNSTLTL